MSLATLERATDPRRSADPRQAAEAPAPSHAPAPRQHPRRPPTRPSRPQPTRRSARRRPMRCTATRPTGSALTRRGRLTVTVAVTLLVLGVGWVAHASSSGEPAAPAVSGTVVVQPGETLWDLAVRANPTADPRRVVDQIERLNDLDGPVLHPGQRLRLPSA